MAFSIHPFPVKGKAALLFLTVLAAMLFVFYSPVEPQQDSSSTGGGGNRINTVHVEVVWVKLTTVDGKFDVMLRVYGSASSKARIDFDINPPFNNLRGGAIPIGTPGQITVGPTTWFERHVTLNGALKNSLINGDFELQANMVWYGGSDDDKETVVIHGWQDIIDFNVAAGGINLDQGVWKMDLNATFKYERKWCALSPSAITSVFEVATTRPGVAGSFTPGSISGLSYYSKNIEGEGTYPEPIPDNSGFSWWAYVEVGGKVLPFTFEWEPVTIE